MYKDQPITQSHIECNPHDIKNQLDEYMYQSRQIIPDEFNLEKLPLSSNIKPIQFNQNNPHDVEMLMALLKQYIEFTSRNEDNQEIMNRCKIIN